MRPRPLLLGLLLLAACKQADVTSDAPRPREANDASVTQFCGMSVSEHGGPKAQIFVRGLPDPYWFSSVRDAFAFTMLQETPKAVSAIYVNDMGRAKNWDQPEAGTWIEAHQAYYVIGSRRRGGMGADEAIPFGSTITAKDFADANGGRIVSFVDMPRDYVLASASGNQP